MDIRDWRDNSSSSLRSKCKDRAKHPLLPGYLVMSFFQETRTCIHINIACSTKAVGYLIARTPHDLLPAYRFRHRHSNTFYVMGENV